MYFEEVLMYNYLKVGPHYLSLNGSDLGFNLRYNIDVV